MTKQNPKTAALRTWGWGWGQGQPTMVICPSLPEGDGTPTLSGWYPSSFHCEQGQKVGLLESAPLDLESGYEMG